MASVQTHVFVLAFCSALYACISPQDSPTPKSGTACQENLETCLSTFEEREEYLTLLRRQPKGFGYLGSADQGEIQILDDSAAIAASERSFYESYLRKGYSPKRACIAAKAGIVSADKYWYFLRDYVQFPSGMRGPYNRILTRGAEHGHSGVAVLPEFPDGSFAILVNFRHATRVFEAEIPKGFVEENETAEQAARREIEEETGAKVGKITFLGVMHPENGTVGDAVPLYRGKVTSQGSAQPEDSEAIAGVLRLSRSELDKAIKAGTYNWRRPNGKTLPVLFRDPFMVYALYLSALHHK